MTKKLIQIPSVSGEEDAIGEFIASQLTKGDVILQDVPGFPPNVIGRRIANKEDAPVIIMNGHMDTVRPLSSWEEDPFKPRLRGNMLYGLGASDMKSGLAVLMNAFLNAENDRINLIFLATVDEEGVCSGAYRFKSEYRGDFSIVGEPSGLRVLLGARGRYVINVCAEGKAAHGARPEEGVNPIEDIGKIVTSLKSIRGKSDKLMGRGSLTPLEISGGEDSLTIPEICSLLIDRHIVPGEKKDDILRELRELISDLSVNSRIHVSLAKRRTPYLEPYVWDKNSPLVRSFIQTCKSVLREEPVISYAQSVGDYNVFGVQMPTVIFGPLGKGSHTTHERVDVRSLSKCERVLTTFLNSLQPSS